jgi:hypothetical protein
MRKMTGTFVREQSGAVTADWVVLTAAVILLVVGTYPAILSATLTPAATINATILSATEPRCDAQQTPSCE